MVFFYIFKFYRKENVVVKEYRIEYNDKFGFFTVIFDQKKTELTGRPVYYGDIYNDKKNHVGVWFCNNAVQTPVLSAAWKRDTDSKWHTNGIFSDILSARIDSVIYGHADDCPF